MKQRIQNEFLDELTSYEYFKNFLSDNLGDIISAADTGNSLLSKLERHSGDMVLFVYYDKNLSPKKEFLEEKAAILAKPFIFCEKPGKKPSDKSFKIISRTPIVSWKNSVLKRWFKDDELLEFNLEDMLSMCFDKKDFNLDNIYVAVGKGAVKNYLGRDRYGSLKKLLKSFESIPVIQLYSERYELVKKGKKPGIGMPADPTSSDKNYEAILPGEKVLFQFIDNSGNIVEKKKFKRTIKSITKYGSVEEACRKVGINNLGFDSVNDAMRFYHDQLGYEKSVKKYGFVVLGLKKRFK